NTSAIFGFVNTLMKILDEKPDHIAVVFDTKEPTFRHVMYQPYKATREKMPEDLSGQIDLLRSEEHTSELQSRENLVCRLLLEKKKKRRTPPSGVRLSRTTSSAATSTLHLTTYPDTPAAAPLTSRDTSCLPRVSPFH